LKNLVERTLLVSGKELLDVDDFKAQNTSAMEVSTIGNMNGLTLEEVDKQRILQAIEQYNGNMSKVALSLGLSRGALYRRLEKYNIVTPKS